MTKPVIRYRAGKWICRGAGHQGSGRTMGAAWAAWMRAKGDANQIEALRRRAAFMAAIQDVGRVWL
jgi:hypothetical protein